jgi:hypothetical protein
MNATPAKYQMPRSAVGHPGGVRPCVHSGERSAPCGVDGMGADTAFGGAARYMRYYMS